MVSAQEYLDQKYPKEKRGSITNLMIYYKELKGELDLRDFVNLRKLDSGGNQLTNIDLSKNVNLTNIDLHGNQLTNIDLSKNTKLERIILSTNQLTNIDLSKNVNLTHLYLSKNVNLTNIDLHGNQLTNIDLSKNVNLTNIDLHGNQLTNIDLSKNVNLETVVIYNNKISANLSIFSHLTNLTKLDLGLESGYANDFYGSLKALEKLTKLEWLCIGQNKKIKEGLEYLPTEKLTHFGCHGTVFEEVLKPYGLGSKGLKK
jgi:Leucine-rich repeat (LRR) protein